MPDGDTTPVRSQRRLPLSGAASRAAAATLRPIAGVATAALDAGLDAERRAVERVLDSDQLARLVSGAIDNGHVQAALKRALHSDGAKQVIATFFESGVFDDVIDQLLASPALWRLIDEVAASPAVRAAVTQQSLGFADQVSSEVRSRSRRADDWLERTAQRLRRRDEQASATAEPQTSS